MRYVAGSPLATSTTISSLFSGIGLPQRSTQKESRSSVHFLYPKGNQSSTQMGPQWDELNRPVSFVSSQYGCSNASQAPGILMNIIIPLSSFWDI